MESTNSCIRPNYTQEDLIVPTLGAREFPAPALSNDDRAEHFVTDDERIRCRVRMGPGDGEEDACSFETAGPRKMLHFDPAQTTAAIVTCGGLSPGLNNVIRSAYYELSYNYGVKRVLGIRNGYRGLNPAHGLKAVEMTHEYVEMIDKLGGSVLGTSRGAEDIGVMADFLVANGVNILLCLGGDGTQRGAYQLYQEIAKRGLDIAVVGIPKTIDDDIPFVQPSFGYSTALEKAAEVIRAAHVEARGAVNGIGLVKLMGRHAGFLAAGATIVSQEVNFCLVPEMPFTLEGENGFLAKLEHRMRNRGHAVIVVAEGAGQEHFVPGELTYDASGNLGLRDVGVLLKERIKDHFLKAEYPVSMKYFDPSYLVRSVPANAYDRFLTDQMARHAIHAAMAGKTGTLIGHEHNQFIHVPIPIVVSQHKRLNTAGDLWRAVLHVTGQGS